MWNGEEVTLQNHHSDSPITFEASDLEEAFHTIEPDLEENVLKWTMACIDGVLPVALKSLNDAWAKEFELQQKETRFFTRHLRKRWKSALSSLAMFITIAEESCSDHVDSIQDSADSSQEFSEQEIDLLNALIPLHVKACEPREKLPLC